LRSAKDAAERKLRDAQEANAAADDRVKRADAEKAAAVKQADAAEAARAAAVADVKRLQDLLNRPAPAPVQSLIGPGFVTKPPPGRR
jgi:molybdenum cofactor biosynthesis enzyme